MSRHLFHLSMTGCQNISITWTARFLNFKYKINFRYSNLRTLCITTTSFHYKTTYSSLWPYCLVSADISSLHPASSAIIAWPCEMSTTLSFPTFLPTQLTWNSYWRIIVAIKITVPLNQSPFHRPITIPLNCLNFLKYIMVLESSLKKYI